MHEARRRRVRTSAYAKIYGAYPILSLTIHIPVFELFFVFWRIQMAHFSYNYHDRIPSEIITRLRVSGSWGGAGSFEGISGYDGFIDHVYVGILPMFTVQIDFSVRLRCSNLQKTSVINCVSTQFSHVLFRFRHLVLLSKYLTTPKFHKNTTFLWNLSRLSVSSPFRPYSFINLKKSNKLIISTHS